MNNIIRIILCFATLFCMSLTAEEYYPYHASIEANICTLGKTYIKLNDGSYWELNLNQSKNVSKVDCSAWRLNDHVILNKGSDWNFPYLLENLNSQQTLYCKSFDPAISHSEISIITSKSVLRSKTDDLNLFSIIRTDAYLI